MSRAISVDVKAATPEQLIKCIEEQDRCIERLRGATDESLQAENARLRRIVETDMGIFEYICDMFLALGMGKYTHTDFEMAKQKGGQMIHVGVRRIYNRMREAETALAAMVGTPLSDPTRPYRGALRRAAERVFKNEVLDAGLEYQVIGGGSQPYKTKDDWINALIEDWIDAAGGVNLKPLAEGERQ